MSGGTFTDTKYESDAGLIFPIRVQPETVSATIGGTANAAPAGDIDAGLPTAYARGGKRQFGLKARRVTVSFSTPPSGYKAGEILSIPILDPTVFAGIAKGQAVSYLGATGTVKNKLNEVLT